jgi:hypothetical protein
MTEAEWLACTDPQPMLEYLRGKASDRKWRLFGCACCREIWQFLTDERSRQAIEVGERFADGETTLMELATARAAAEAAHAEASATADNAMRAMNHGDFVYYANLRATGFAAGAAVECATYPAVAATTSIAENFIGTAATRCVSNLEAVWWGWDDPNAAAEQAAVERDARNALCALIRDIFSKPFGPAPRADPCWPAWNGGAILKLARTIYDERAFDRLPILADALEEAGCSEPAILSHCRSGSEHVRGCWVIDLLLGRE